MEVEQFKERIASLESELTQAYSQLEELQQENKYLSNSKVQHQQTPLLSTVAKVANLLLRSPDYTLALPNIARSLGDAVGSDRCVIIKRYFEPQSNKSALELLTEWCHVGIRSVLTKTPELQKGLIIENAPNFEQQLLQGKGVNFLVDRLQDPMYRLFFEVHDNLSMLMVPIMVQERFWGIIGFDNCTEQRLYDEAEVAILEVVADSIAAAISCQQKDNELRRSEALHRSLFEISNEEIYRWELERTVSIELSHEEQISQIYENCAIVQSNSALGRVNGFENRKKLVKSRMPQIPIFKLERSRSFIRSCVENEYCIRNVESEVVDANKQTRYCLNSITFFVEENVTTGGWSTQNDITELRKIQQEFLQVAQKRSQKIAHLNVELQQTFDLLQAREYLLEATAEAVNALLTKDDFDEAINTALQAVGESLDADRAKILESLIDDPNHPPFRFHHVLCEWIQPDKTERISRSHIKQFNAICSEQIVEKVLQNNGFGGRLEEWGELLKPYFQAAQVKSFYAVPIRVHERWWGLLCFDDCLESKHRSQVDLAVLQIAANCIGSAIERRRTLQALLQAEQKRAADLEKTNQALKNSIDRLSADLDLNGFLGHVVLEIIHQLSLSTAWVELYDPASQSLRIYLHADQGAFYFYPNHLSKRFSVSNDVTWNLLLQSKKPMAIDLDSLDRFFLENSAEIPRQWAQQQNIQSGINILLMLGDEPLGRLVLFSTELQAFSCEKLELAQVLAQQVIWAIVLTRLAEENRQLAIIRDRTHLAREIHDTLAQGYAGILMQIQAANFLREQPDLAETHLDYACNLAREGIADARRSVWLLQQDSDAYRDISSILAQLVKKMSIGSKILPQITIDGVPCRVKPEIGMHLFRIAQESLNNALCHAKATAISIGLRYAPQQLQMTIEDNGCGFDTANVTQGFGIKGMRQRAEIVGAQLMIQSKPARGTRILLNVSLL
jgi:signal transduction histidine kinase